MRLFIHYVMTLFECNDMELDTVIALANLTYDAKTDTYEVHPSDEKVFNDFIIKNP
jgi:hypothetical protein